MNGGLRKNGSVSHRSSPAHLCGQQQQQVNTIINITTTTITTTTITNITNITTTRLTITITNIHQTREAEKAPLGSKETFFQIQVKFVYL